MLLHIAEPDLRIETFSEVVEAAMRVMATLFQCISITVSRGGGVQHDERTIFFIHTPQRCSANMAGTLTGPLDGTNSSTLLQFGWS